MLIQGWRLLLIQVEKLRGFERDRWGDAHPEAPSTHLDVLSAQDTQSRALCPLWDDILSNYNAFLPLLMAIFVDKVQLGNYPPVMSNSAQMTFISTLPQAVSVPGSDL